MIEKYIRQALEICLNMKNNDRFMMITDLATRNLGERFIDIAKTISPGQSHLLYIMEEMGERGGKSPLKIPEKVLDIFEEIDLSAYAAGGLPGELDSFRQPMLQKVSATKKVRHGHMPGLTEEILQKGFGENYQQVVDLTHRVYDVIKYAKTARVQTKLGTDFKVSFNPEYKWITSDAIIGPGEYGNIPSGEVFTCVETCEGKLIIDGEVGDYLCAKYGILKENPVEIEVINGRASSIQCQNKNLLNDLEAYFTIDENANRIGEFAVGTNINLDHFIGNLLLDEKFPGIHVAFGSGYPDKTGATWDGKAHLDCIVTNPTIEIDGDLIMKNGEFCL